MTFFHFSLFIHSFIFCQLNDWCDELTKRGALECIPEVNRFQIKVDAILSHSTACVIDYINSTETKKTIEAPQKTAQDILKKLDEQSDFAHRCINDAKTGFNGWFTSIKCKGVSFIVFDNIAYFLIFQNVCELKIFSLLVGDC